jgi:dolichol-phosphate mannosyltransferase
MSKILIAIPTYNERENAPELWRQIHALGPDWDVLFVDDNSPDGTGEALEAIAANEPRLRVLRRAGKLGIGSAHIDAIQYAYKNKYDTLVTMDCDFTHSPNDIQRFLDASNSGAALVAGSRYVNKESLKDWNLFRLCITHFAHFLTNVLLGIPYDASGGFRCYDLHQIPERLFMALRSKSYSFFFESMFLIHHSKFKIAEVPINLPSRTYGTSKLNSREALRSATFLMQLFAESKLNPGRFRFGRQIEFTGERYADGEAWRDYWGHKKDATGLVYECIASVYRQCFIRPNLERVLRRTYSPSSELLHAGCGSGQVDTRLHKDFKITAMDVSDLALYIYAGNNPEAHRILQGSIFEMPFPDGSLDGVYNMGVVEHFYHEDIVKIMAEVKRILKPGGKFVCFWPHRKAPSVKVIKCMEFVTNLFKSKKVVLHPAEVSLLSGRDEAELLLKQAGLELSSYTYGARDLFIQAVVVGHKRD